MRWRVADPSASFCIRWLGAIFHVFSPSFLSISTFYLCFPPLYSPNLGIQMSLTKKKEDEKEKKFLGRLQYKLDYDFEKNAVGLVVLLPACNLRKKNSKISHACSPIRLDEHPTGCRAPKLEYRSNNKFFSWLLWLSKLRNFQQWTWEVLPTHMSSSFYFLTRRKSSRQKYKGNLLIQSLMRTSHSKWSAMKSPSYLKIAGSF